MCRIYFLPALVISCLLNLSSAGVLESKSSKPGEDWVYLKNQNLTLGLLRSHGGAIGYLSSSNSNINVFNHYDHGRLVQQSYYGDKDGSRWVKKLWRYNPVQGGDYRGKAAKLVEFHSTDKTAYAKTIPRHWASGELLEECRMEQWIELDGPVVKACYKFTYNGTKTYQPRHQETPAVFISPKLSTLATYAGKKPWTDDVLTTTTPGWPNKKVTMSENWASYVDEQGEGVGVYVPETMEATVYRYQGGGGSNCSYIAPLRTFAITPKLTFSYNAYFTLGNLSTIRKRFETLHKNQEQPEP